MSPKLLQIHLTWRRGKQKGKQKQKKKKKGNANQLLFQHLLNTISPHLHFHVRDKNKGKIFSENFLIGKKTRRRSAAIILSFNISNFRPRNQGPLRISKKKKKGKETQKKLFFNSTKNPRKQHKKNLTSFFFFIMHFPTSF